MLTSVMADWFYGKDSTQHGPVSEQEIRNLISSGQIDINTIIWREGMTDWLPMKDVAEFQALSNSGTPTQGSQPYTTPTVSNTAAPVHHAPVAPTDALSIVSLVCGILALITCWLAVLLGIPAVICGHLSLKKIKHSPTPIAGKGMAMAGLICGYIGLLIWLLLILFYVGLFAAAASTGSGSSYP